MTTAAPLGAHETVERLATHCRAEQLVFAVLGDGATRIAASNSAGVLAAAADHAAWRARRWYELLPTAPPGPDALVGPTDADREVLAAVREHAVGEVELLAIAAVELLPRLLRSAEDHLARCTAVADAPVRRILAIASTDLRADLADLLGAFERAVVEPADRDRADRAAGAVAAIAARAGWPIAEA